jgi:predicted transglutaminase-like cysteine proteinase
MTKAANIHFHSAALHLSGQWRLATALIALLCLLLPLREAVCSSLFDLNAALQACQVKYGTPGSKAAQEWHNALTLLRSGSEQTRLKEINEFFNRRMIWDTDQNIWGQNDYWATPVESLIRGMADCEDFAIAKYFSLKYVGVPVAKMRITYVKAKIGGPSSNITQAHMVLTYYPTPDAEPLILDNLVSEIRPASRRPDLIPVFSFNTDGVWAAGSSEPQQGGSRLSRWNDLLEKMKSEGFGQ